MVKQAPRPPLPSTPLIGRAREMASVCELLEGGGSRLVTLVGPPGVGKTLLAQHLSMGLTATFTDGAAFVALDSIRDVSLVTAVVARTLNLRAQGSRSSADIVLEHLRDRNMLLVLDNFEHVIGAASFVADLLAACPRLVVLVTSRTPLHLRWEQQVPLEPLALPPTEFRTRHRLHAATLEDVGGYAAIELFVMRARAVRPAFALTAAVAGDIAGICTRLDGLPLAIELAAACVRLLSTREIAERLTQRLTLLTGGFRDLPERQQTLRAAIDWSFDLLTPDEQQVFRILGIFAGGCTLDALASVAGALGAATSATGILLPEASPPFDLQLLDLVGKLVDRSLVRRVDDLEGGSRYEMLQTIREYALDRLEAAGELHAAQLHLATWYAGMVSIARQRLTGTEQAAWFARLDAEQDNIRAVLQWSLDAGQHRLGLEIAASLWFYWQTRGLAREGLQLLSQLLVERKTVPASLRAAALHSAGILATELGNFTAAEDRFREAHALRRELGDEVGVAASLRHLGIIAHHQGDYSAARAQFEEALAITRRVGTEQQIAGMIGNVALAAEYQGDRNAARQHLEEAVAIFRRLGDRLSVGRGLNNLGINAAGQRRAGEARAFLEEAIAIHEELGNRPSLATALHTLSLVALQQQLPDEALRHARRSLAIRAEIGDERGIASAHNAILESLLRGGALAAARESAREALTRARTVATPSILLDTLWMHAVLALDQGLHAPAAVLFAASAHLRDQLRLPLPPDRQYWFETDIAQLRKVMVAQRFAESWGSGSSLTPEEAIQIALSLHSPTDEQHSPADERPIASRPSPPRLTPPSTGRLNSLSAREVEVLRLLAAGHSNRAIAARLVVSERTVEHHITSIYRKIDARGRVDATAYALRHGLAEPV